VTGISHRQLSTNAVNDICQNSQKDHEALYLTVKLLVIVGRATEGEASLSTIR
jgi:hypothetical protein